MAEGQQQTINVSDLSIPQLRDVKRQLDEELTHLTASFQQLKLAQAKFKARLGNISDISSPSADRRILVPLTNSLYVPGKLRDTESVIVDVGTGYYVKKNRADATKHYTAKVDFVRESIDKLQKALEKKQDNMQYVVNLLHMKEQQAVAAASKSGSGKDN